MKAKDLQERTTENLLELEKTLRHQLFEARFKNHTNRLNDTASIRTSRRDLARVKTVLNARALAAAAASTGLEGQG